MNESSRRRSLLSFTRGADLVLVLALAACSTNDAIPLSEHPDSRLESALAGPGAHLLGVDEGLLEVLETGFVPDVARRVANERASLLASRGIAWVLVPCDESRATDDNHAAFVLALLDGVAEAGVQTVLDARNVDITRESIVGRALRHGCGAIATSRTDAERLFERSGIRVPVVDAKRIGDEAPDASDAIRSSKIGALAARHGIVLLRDPRYALPVKSRITVRVLGPADTARAARDALARAGIDATFASQSSSETPVDVTLMFGRDTPLRPDTLAAGSALLFTAGRGLTDIDAMARAIAGLETIDGRLAKPLADFSRGAGITVGTAAASLVASDARAAGFAGDLQKRVKSFASSAIANRIFPGCQIVVAHGDKLVLDLALGHETYDDDSPEITRQHRYDLASVTKIAASTAVAMELCGDGKLDLDAHVGDVLPDFIGNDTQDADAKRSITLRMLLTHSAGMAPWKQLWTLATGEAAILRVTYDEPLRFRPGTSFAYSDLGLITFGKCLEAIGGDRLDRLAERLVFDPLGMKRTRFGPIPLDLPVVPTEDVPGRGGVIHHRVHDENADALGGIAGHAGLFSTADDLVRFCRLIAAGGAFDGYRLCPREVVDRFCARQSDVFETSRAIGFDTPTKGNSAGSSLSPNSVGHTGFTGTSFWIDRTRDLVVVCLTNRVHPSRNEPRINAFRRNLHDLVVACLVADPAQRKR
ncbi:MAG: beta-lactamase family protein [Planctomycetes bacterium]|nr:beta-lactamase family protein [Planctomycetota bacterium]